MCDVRPAATPQASNWQGGEPRRRGTSAPSRARREDPHGRRRPRGSPALRQEFGEKTARSGVLGAKLVRRLGIEPRTYRLRDTNRYQHEAIVAQRILKIGKQLGESSTGT